MMNGIFSIAIDGPAGAGKSTVARAAAAELGAMYLDTGAMYRTVGLYMIRRDLIGDNDAVAAKCGDMDIGVSFDENSVQHMLLDGEDVTDLIRTDEASMAASAVGAVPQVRERLVALQQQTARQFSIVMDGRDIGTQVLPDATLKIFLTASAEIRALRRYAQQREDGKKPKFHEILDDIVERDYNDSHRAASPLMRAKDAVLVDTSAMTLEESVAKVVSLSRAAIGGAHE